MGISAKNITQGGQVTAYNWRMYLQINNWVTFWCSIVFSLLTATVMWVISPKEVIINGAWHWFAKTNASLLVLGSGNNKLFDIHYYYAQTNTTYTIKMTMAQMITDPYMIAMGDQFMSALEKGAVFGGGVALCLFFGVNWFLGNEGRKLTEDEFISGQTLSEDPKEVTKLLKKKGKASDLKIGMLAMIKNAEMQNFGMHGTVGTGKSTIIRELLNCIRKRGDRVIIYDSGCTFIESHYRENFDTILNPYDERCANWDLWGECSSMPDFDNMANALIPVEGESADPFWVSSARTIFAATAARMADDPNRSIEELLRVLLSINMKGLRSFLEKTEAASLVEEKIEKTAISIRSVITNYAKSLRYLQGLDKDGKEKFTIRDWMLNPDKAKSWLFISTNAQQKASLRPLITMWLALATINLLSMEENYNRRVWFFIDEIPGLQKIPELPGVMAEARKYGGCFVLGMQNMPQMIQIYGKNMGQSINDLLNTRIFFRSPSSDVAQQVERELGRQRRKEGREQNSYGLDQIRDGVSLSSQAIHEPIVDYDQIMQLEDLNFYVKFPGEYPVVKMALDRKGTKKINKGLLLRDFSTSLNPDIERMVKANESAITDVLFNKDDAPIKADQPEAQKNNAAEVKPAVQPKKEKIDPTWDITSNTVEVEKQVIVQPPKDTPLVSESIQVNPEPVITALAAPAAAVLPTPEISKNEEPQTVEIRPATGALVHQRIEKRVVSTAVKHSPKNQSQTARSALPLNLRRLQAQSAAQNSGDDEGAREIQQKLETEDDQGQDTRSLQKPLLSADAHLTEQEKQQIKEQEDAVQLMMDEEKNILRHHKPGEKGYETEVAQIGEMEEMEL